MSLVLRVCSIESSTSTVSAEESSIRQSARIVSRLAATLANAMTRPKLNVAAGATARASTENPCHILKLKVDQTLEVCGSSQF
jgi:hypothetical protein